MTPINGLLEVHYQNLKAGSFDLFSRQVGLLSTEHAKGKRPGAF
jgi:hypothetical protein